MKLSKYKLNNVKRLLKLLKEYPSCFHTGLCSFILSLRWYRIISFEEYDELDEIIDIIKPKKYMGI